MKKMMLALLASVLLFTVAIGDDIAKEGPSVDGLKQASVLVMAPDRSSGSGVVFKNGEVGFVWTDAHVVFPVKTIKTVTDPKTDKAVVRCTFGNVELQQEDYQDGRKVGLMVYLASVIRYSENEDIALLRVHKRNWPATSVVFCGEDIPTAGTAVWHIGSMNGVNGNGSVSDGIFSTAGRLRRNFYPDEVSGYIYDQVSLNAIHHGCSGGGVFRKSDLKCLGLITEFLGPNDTAGAAMITPTRRLRAFAKRTKCEFAMDANVKVPERDDVPAMCDDLPLPEVRPATPPDFRLPILPIPLPPPVPDMARAKDLE